MDGEVQCFQGAEGGVLLVSCHTLQKEPIWRWPPGLQGYPRVAERPSSWPPSLIGGYQRAAPPQTRRRNCPQVVRVPPAEEEPTAQDTEAGKWKRMKSSVAWVCGCVGAGLEEIPTQEGLLRGVVLPGLEASALLHGRIHVLLLQCQLPKVLVFQFRILPASQRGVRAHVLEEGQLEANPQIGLVWVPVLLVLLGVADLCPQNVAQLPVDGLVPEKCE